MKTKKTMTWALLFQLIGSLSQPIFARGQIKANYKTAQLNEATNLYNGAQSLISLYIALGGGTK